jgi:hypothetical protein
LILVPPEELAQEFNEAVERAEGAGIILAVASDDTRKILASHIARHFNVSLDVVMRRIKADNLWPT